MVARVERGECARQLNNSENSSRVLVFRVRRFAQKMPRWKRVSRQYRITEAFWMPPTCREISVVPRVNLKNSSGELFHAGPGDIAMGETAENLSTRKYGGIKKRVDGERERIREKCFI